jgi:hypothetical protein
MRYDGGYLFAFTPYGPGDPFLFKINFEKLR